MALFESYERRIENINAVLNSYGIASIEEAEKITKDAGLDVYAQVKAIQPICFENACWAYTVGAAIAIKKNCRTAAEAAAAIEAKVIMTPITVPNKPINGPPEMAMVNSTKFLFKNCVSRTKAPFNVALIASINFISLRSL